MIVVMVATTTIVVTIMKKLKWHPGELYARAREKKMVRRDSRWNFVSQVGTLLLLLALEFFACDCLLASYDFLAVMVTFIKLLDVVANLTRWVPRWSVEDLQLIFQDWELNSSFPSLEADPQVDHLFCSSKLKVKSSWRKRLLFNPQFYLHKFQKNSFQVTFLQSLPSSCCLLLGLPSSCECPQPSLPNKVTLITITIVIIVIIVTIVIFQAVVNLHNLHLPKRSPPKVKRRAVREMCCNFDHRNRFMFNYLRGCESQLVTFQRLSES